MFRFLGGFRVLTPGVFVFAGLQGLLAQPQNEPQRAVAILGQAREAAGGEAWNLVAELRAEGTVVVEGKIIGTIATIDDLRTGANADRVDLQDRGRVKTTPSCPYRIGSRTTPAMLR
jgi:hypothetical protein